MLKALARDLPTALNLFYNLHGDIIDQMALSRFLIDGEGLVHVLIFIQRGPFFWALRRLWKTIRTITRDSCRISKIFHQIKHE